jgi:hypothetical protein
MARSERVEKMKNKKAISVKKKKKKKEFSAF